MTATLLPGAYLAMRRKAAGLTIADVADRIGTDPRLGEIDRRELIEQIEADPRGATIHTLTALRRAYPFSVDVLSQLARLADGEPFPPPRLCRVCGCSELDACSDRSGYGCWWVERDFCSSCAAADDRAAGAEDLQDAGPDDFGQAERS
ncbi:helix-turn-helix transcriptional regulator [uncultured Sphingomonas sp.]|uniref:helix-turn-helix domain-containing protein n=1 Tax=uncultured Sphingomonas sp. TaxID=158754 RepID=UPI0025E9AB97|nr:helix-turn-helix transcriptional regulator [uncultured Sphingomonas sp.]